MHALTDEHNAACRVVRRRRRRRRAPRRFKELKDYVLARRDALGGGRRKGGSPAITDLDMDDDEAMRKSKGFA